MDKFPSWVKLLKTWRPNHAPFFHGSLVRWNVYRDTARTRRLAGYLEYRPAEGAAAEGEVPDNILRALTRELNRAGHFTEERLLLLLSKEAAILKIPANILASRLVDTGWLGRWVRLNPDEKTIHFVEYGPMPPLTRLLDEHRQQQLDNHCQWLADRDGRFKKIVLMLEKNAGESIQENAGTIHKDNLVSALKNIRQHIQAEIEELKGTGSGEKVLFHPNHPWPFTPVRTSSKFHLGVDFLLALAECLLEMPEGFEWKEIGARFAPSIGGSKYFDPARDELIQMAETVCGVPLDRLGLTSLGSLYSLYSLGGLELARGGTNLVYPRDTLYALSNIQVDRAGEVSTGAGRIILTENRALLLKMGPPGGSCGSPGHWLSVSTGASASPTAVYWECWRRACCSSPALSRASDSSRIRETFFSSRSYSA